MRAWMAAAVWLSAIPGAPAQAAQRLEIRGFAGQVTIIPEARSSFAVGAIKRVPSLPFKVRRAGDVTIIDGGLEHRTKGCPLAAGERGVRVSGLGFLPMQDLPRLVVRAPMELHVSVGDAVGGVIGRAATLDLDSRGCGDWTIANVRGRLRLTQVGAGHLTVGGAGDADLNVAGGGRIAVRSIVGTLNAVSTGEGTVYVAEVDGPVVARVAGSGSVEVAAGGAPELNAQVAGGGVVRFGGSAGAVVASVAGRGEVDVARASGPVSRRVFGSGQVVVGGDRR